MSKSIKNMKDKFTSTASLEKTVATLKKENKALQDTVSKLLKEVDRLNDIDKKSVVALDLTPEQQIIEMQIMRLQATSLERALSYDETRMLDIHIKNKRLLEDKSTMNADYKTLPSTITDDELMRIAENVEIEEKPKKGRRSKPKTSS